jgi:hypothetical protein
MENRKIVDFIISEYEQIQGELIIQEVFAKEVDDKILELVNKKNTGLTSLISELVFYQELGKEKTDLMNRLEYLKGMLEAYAKVIQEIKKEEE